MIGKKNSVENSELIASDANASRGITNQKKTDENLMCGVTIVTNLTILEKHAGRFMVNQQIEKAAKWVTNPTMEFYQQMKLRHVP